MSDTTTAAEDKKISLNSPAEGMSAMTLVIGESFRQLIATAESQQTAILAMTAMLALSPATAEIDPKRLGVVVQALTQNRKDADKVREQVAAYVGAIVGIASNLPKIMADAEKAEKAAGGRANGKMKSN